MMKLVFDFNSVRIITCEDNGNKGVTYCNLQFVVCAAFELANSLSLLPHLLTQCHITYHALFC